MYERNEWKENEKFSLKKIAQDVIATSKHDIVKTSCCIDTTKTITGPCNSDVTTSCCIDTTKTIAGPCSDITTSCCIDTL